MIDFELPPALKMIKDFTHGVGRDTFRPISRKYDEEEHTTAEEIAFMAPIMAARRATRQHAAGGAVRRSSVRGLARQA